MQHKKDQEISYFHLKWPRSHTFKTLLGTNNEETITFNLENAGFMDKTERENYLALLGIVEPLTVKSLGENVYSVKDD